MSAKRIIAGLAGVVALLAVLVVLYETKEKPRLEASVAGLRKERDALQARVLELEKRLAPLERVDAASPENEKANATGGFDLRAYEQDKARRQKDVATAVAKAQIAFVCSPEMQELAAKRLGANLPLRYGPLYAALNLPPEKIRKFEATMLQRYWAIADMLSVATAKGVSVSDPSVFKMEDQALAGLEGELQDLLGRDGYEQYRRYETTAAAQGFVDTLAAKVFHTPTPLTALQAARFSEVVVAHSAAMPQGPGDWLRAQTYAGGRPQPTAINDVDWEVVFEQSKSVLSPAQIAALQAWREQTELEAQLLKRTRKYADDFRNSLSAKPGEPAP